MIAQVLKRLFKRISRNIARPDFELGEGDRKLQETEFIVQDILARQRRLEDRQRMLIQQTNPRGYHET